jgi:hypothetical protein
MLDYFTNEDPKRKISVKNCKYDEIAYVFETIDNKLSESYFYFILDIAEGNYMFIGLAVSAITLEQSTENLSVAILNRDPSLKFDASEAVYSAADYLKYFGFAANFNQSQVIYIELRKTNLAQRKSFSVITN